jgi:dolichyl-phosphate beta-glucosyltransferase
VNVISELRSLRPKVPRLSVVIPAYNEAARIGRTIEALREYVGRTEAECDVIVADDGSDDGTADVALQAAQRGRIGLIVLCSETNRGKGYAVRDGMIEASGDILLMCDADLSTPFEELEKLLPWLERGYDVVIGSRDLPESKLDPPQPLARRLMAWVFRAIRRRFLLPALKDTQCGFKLFRREAGHEIFSQATVNGWLFDCEVLGIAERLGYRIKEVGVTWRNDPDSRVSALREAFFALPTLISIRRRLARLQK